MTLALFDLDHTLLDGDTERLWATRQIELGFMEASVMDRFAAFDQDYVAGKLDLRAYMRYYFEPHQRLPRTLLEQARDQFLEEVIRPRLRLAKQVAWHREQGHDLVLITASSCFTGLPIAKLLGFVHGLATDIEETPERFTGEIIGTPCFREQKLVRLQALMEAHGWSLEESWGYSDSINDLPLLEAVTHPVLVTPDARLQAIGEARGWKILEDLS